MAKTTVESLTLTVTKVKVFLDTMKLVNELDLWDEVEEYLAGNGKTEMFFDYDVLHHFQEMLKNDQRIDPDDETIKIVFRHNIPYAKYLDEKSSD